MELINNLNQFAQIWWQWMSSMFWQVSLFILIIALIDMFVRKWAWPQVRYALWLLVLVKLIVPPTWELNTSVITQIRPKVETPIISQIQFIIKEQNIDENQFLEPVISTSYDNTVQSKSMSSLPTTMPEKNPELSWKTYLLFIWIGGMVLFILLLAIRIRRLHQWHEEQDKQSIPEWFHQLLVNTAFYFDLQSLPAIVFSDKAVTPAVYGIFHPVMLLPVNYFVNLSKKEAEHVLLHELAHLKRGDLWLHGVTIILQIVYWFNPLFIYVRKQMKHVREICCDLTVANVLREKTEHYRMTLLNTARGLLTESLEPGLGLLGVFEEPFRLVSRLKWLEKKTWEFRRHALIASLLTTLLVVACFMPMSSKKPKTVAQDKLQKDGKVIAKNPVEIETDQGMLASTFSIVNTHSIYSAVLIQEGQSMAPFQKAASKCRAELEKQKIEFYGDPFGRFFTDPKKVPKDKQYWEVGFQIKKDSHVKPPLELREIAPLKVARLSITGVKNTEKVWEQFLAALLKHDYLPCFPPAMEIWRGEQYDKPAQQSIEMQIPIISLDDPATEIDVEFKKRKKFTAIVLPKTGSTGQIGEAQKNLKAYMTQNGIESKGDFLGEFYYDWAEIPPSEWEWIIGCPVNENTVVEEPFQVRYYDEAQIASAKFRSNRQAELAWSPFICSIILNKKTPIGPAMEVYNLKKGITELQIPVVGEIVEKKNSAFIFSEAESMSSSSLMKDKIESISNKLHLAMINNQIEEQLVYYCDDAASKLDFGPELKGKDTLRKRMITDKNAGFKWIAFNTIILTIEHIDNTVLETGLYRVAVFPEYGHGAISGVGKYFRMWKIDSQGDPKIKYSIWNQDNPNN